MQSKITGLIVIAFWSFAIKGNLVLSQEKSIGIDKTNTKVEFKIKHLGLLDVDGTFDTFYGEIVMKNNTIQSLSVSMLVSSINTLDKTRDKTLREKEYLNAEDYPRISFSSELVDENKITGKLKIKDVERKVALSYSKSKTNQIELHTTISRAYFKLNFGLMDNLIGDKIQINGQIQLY